MSEIGKRLREERERLGLSLDTISQYTKIPQKYLRALENNDYLLLPSMAHTKAFIGKYADLLGLPKKQLLALFKAEHYQEEKIIPQKHISVFKKLSHATIVLTTNQAVIFVVACISLIFLFYIYSQLRTLLAAPYIVLNSPSEGEIVEETYITVEGQTENDAILLINNHQIDVESDGYFKEKIELSNEYNQNIIVTAINKVSKAKTEIRRAIKVNISAVATILETPTTPFITTSHIKLNIRVTQDTWLRIEIDGNRTEFIMPRKTSNVFYANKKISVRSGKAQATYISYNDEPEEVMGPPGPLTKVWVASSK